MTAKHDTCNVVRALDLDRWTALLPVRLTPIRPSTPYSVISVPLYRMRRALIHHRRPQARDGGLDRSTFVFRLVLDLCQDLADEVKRLGRDDVDEAIQWAIREPMLTAVARATTELHQLLGDKFGQRRDAAQEGYRVAYRALDEVGWREARAYSDWLDSDEGRHERVAVRRMARQLMEHVQHERYVIKFADWVEHNVKRLMDEEGLSREAALSYLGSSTQPEAHDSDWCPCLMLPPLESAEGARA